MKYLIVFMLSILFGCNSLLKKDILNCSEAQVDQGLKTPSYHRNAIEGEDFTGKVVNNFENNPSQTEWILYFENGEIIRSESFYENGNLKLMRSIMCNSSHGMVIHYDTNGIKTHELEFKLGRKDGVGISYFENGNIQKLLRFEGDLKHGKQYEFSIGGNTIMVEVYDQGEKVE